MLSNIISRDASKATAFILPFDFGTHTMINEVDGSPMKKSPFIRERIHPIFHSVRNAPEYATIPPESSTLKPPGLSRNNSFPPLYWRNNGHDHILILGATIFNKLPMPFYHIIESVCRHCIIISIETTPTVTPFHKGFSQNYIYAVPYPSSFHYHEQIKTLPWVIQEGAAAPARDILSLFIGSTKTLTPTSNKLRRVLQQQCKSNPIKSVKCVWEATAHSCTAVIKDGASAAKQSDNPIYLFLRSVFCLSPAGDSYTRKAIFDSMLGGCIPVVFTRGSISQYHWFLSDEEVSVRVHA